MTGAPTPRARRSGGKTAFAPCTASCGTRRARFAEGVDDRLPHRDRRGRRRGHSRRPSNRGGRGRGGSSPCCSVGSSSAPCCSCDARRRNACSTRCRATRAILRWSPAIMSWDVHALLTHPFHLFDAPIFSPRTLTLAYSDLLLPAAPLYALLHGVTGSFVAALNLTSLLLMVFTQATTYALAKRLTARDDAAIISALASTFSGYALADWGHPQLQLLGMLPLGFLVLFRLLDAPTTRNAAVCGAVTAAIALGALYYGALFALCAVAVVLGHVWSQRYRLKEGLWRGIAIAVVVAGVLVLPFAVGYTRLQSQPGFDRPSVPEWGLKGADLLDSRASQLSLRLDGAHRARARRRAHALRGVSRDGPRRRRSGLGAATPRRSYVARRRARGRRTRRRTPPPRAPSARARGRCVGRPRARARGLRRDDTFRADARPSTGLRGHPGRRPTRGGGLAHARGAGGLRVRGPRRVDCEASSGPRSRCLRAR